MRPIAKYEAGQLWRDEGYPQYLPVSRSSLSLFRWSLSGTPGHDERINQINQAIAAYDKDHQQTENAA